jgi:CRP-like cAMP-binding protein
VLPVRDAILTRIWYVARRHGLQIPYPIAVQYRYEGSPSPPVPAPAELLERFPRYRHVRQVLLDAADRRKGTGDQAAGARETAPEGARVLMFSAGGEMLPFGSTRNGFTLIVEGNATLSARDADGREVGVSSLGPGDFYGEATISAGRPSDLRVVAKTDVTVVAFDAIQMAECLQRSTGLATEIGDAIDARRRAASAIRQRHSDQPS